MITKIKINGFKSFQDFEMTFTPLTIVAGANASGKSNLFDALQLLSRLADMDLKTAFTGQRGNPSELFTTFDDNSISSEMEFIVEMLLNRKIKDNWGGSTELNSTRLRYRLIIVRIINDYGVDDIAIKHESLEKIKPAEDRWIKEVLPKPAKSLSKTLKGGGSPTPFIYTDEQKGITQIRIRQDGIQGGKATPASSVTQTVIGSINSIDFPHAFAVKEEMRSWKFLQLNPEDLRKPTPQEMGMHDYITLSGKNLASTLYRISKTDDSSLIEISRKINSFLPNYVEVMVEDDKTNRQFVIKIKDEDNTVFSSRVLSEGTLRLLALCILEYDDKHTGLLCFEEPENGIHPFRIHSIFNLLKDLSTDFSDAEHSLRQVIANTHSPVLVREVLRWHEDINVSLLFSRQITFLTNNVGNRVKIKITRMSPVVKKFQDPQQLSMFSTSKAEFNLTISEVMKYLQTEDLDNI